MNAFAGRLENKANQSQTKPIFRRQKLINRMDRKMAVLLEKLELIIYKSRTAQSPKSLIG